MDRDFRFLTPSEVEEWNQIKSEERVPESGNLRIRKIMYDRYPEAVRRNISLFPNQYLDVKELDDQLRMSRARDELEGLIENSESNEREILNFINASRYHFIVGSLLKEYFNFGHHEAHCFKEFPLGTSHRADYLLVGRNSDGWHFVFVEFESPYGNITTKSGDLGSVFRKGISQIEDWRIWLQKNVAFLKEYFGRQIKEGDSLPDDFNHYDPSRTHYVVIAGRRSDFKEKTYQIRRNGQKDSGLIIIHYDNLLDAIGRLIGSRTY